MDFVHPVEAVIPGVQGRVLAVLVETSAELNVRTIARLAGVSAAQVSRILPGLVDLGIVDRREVPPSSQFRLVRSNVAARVVIDLARSRDAVIETIGAQAANCAIPPMSVIVFGSFARGEAGRDSDLDVIIVRPDDIDLEDEGWIDGIETWRVTSSAIAGNPVEVLEFGRSEIRRRLGSDGQLWHDVRREGIVVHGLDLNELEASVDA